MIEILKKIASTTSRNAKHELLMELASSDDAKLAMSVFHLAYEPTITYGVKEFDTSKYSENPEETLDSAIKALSQLVHRTITGNAAVEFVEDMCSRLSKDESEVFANIVKRDLRAGISASSINKVFPGLIYEHSYMRCSGFSEKTLSKIKFPCYSQTKMDGLYVDLVSCGDVDIYTRNGQLKTNDFKDAVLFAKVLTAAEGYVLMGEAICVDESGNLLDRKASNGYLNSDDVDARLIRYFVWDVVPIKDFRSGKCTIPYSERLLKLTDIVNEINDDHISIVNTVVCDSAEDIINHFKEERIKGNEGTVIKDFDGHWKDHTSPHQIKCKVIFDCDLKVVGYKLGTGKHEGKLGAIQCQSIDGLLEVSVGGGYKDSERESFLTEIDSWIKEGKIITVRGNDVVNDENNPGKFSIFLPRFVEIRDDKSEADSLERIQEQVKSFTNLLQLIK